MKPTTLVDPYPITTEFPDNWSHESADVFDEGEREYGCCEGGWLPLSDGTWIECHVCGGEVQ
jgi:hypothetical protein